MTSESTATAETPTPATTPNEPLSLEAARQRIAALQAEYAGMFLPDDAPGNWSRNEASSYEQKRRNLNLSAGAASRAVGEIAQCEAELATLSPWRDHLAEWRRILCDELLALPPRDTRSYGLTWGIKRIDGLVDLLREAGPAHSRLDDLMAAAGYIPRDLIARANGEQWHGALPAVERRLRELGARIDEARRTLRLALSD